jgi:hypothetical protein
MFKTRAVKKPDDVILTSVELLDNRTLSYLDFMYPLGELVSKSSLIFIIFDNNEDYYAPQAVIDEIARRKTIGAWDR